MDENKIDGEIHPLSDDFAYISECVKDHSLENNSDMKKKHSDFIKKYAEYLYKFDKENVIKNICSDIKEDIFFQRTCLDYQFIYRPPFLTGSLSNHGRISLKFKRCKNDDLKEDLH
jgi:hypothetical protein